MPNEAIAELESTLAFIRQKKAARRLLAGAQNAAPAPSTAPNIAARIARLQSITAAAKETLGRSAAKASKPALKAAAKPAAPAPRAVRQPAATMPPNLDAKARRAWAKAQNAMTPENARTFSDSYLQAAATHRHSPPAEAAIAKAELEARGFVFHPSGTISRSIR